MCRFLKLFLNCSHAFANEPGNDGAELNPNSCKFLGSGNWRATLRSALPHAEPLSNNHLLPLDKALVFVHGLLAEARKLTHVAYLRRDPLVPELLGIRRVASQSSLSRFVQGFDSAAVNLRCFRSLGRWGLARLPSRPDGYTLDLDSTRLLHEDGQQEGVAVGYTKRGLKPCLHPLLANEPPPVWPESIHCFPSAENALKG